MLRARGCLLPIPMFAVRVIPIVLLSAILLSPGPVSAHDPSAFGGLFRSRDGGVTWFPANPGRIVSGAIALAINPLEPNHLLFATDSGLLRSRNAGLDWSLEAPSVLVGAVFAVTFDADGRRALASTGTALFRNDGGETWHAVTAPVGALPARLLVADGRGRVYLVGWHQLAASDDWARSWKAIGSPAAGAPVSQIVVARDSGAVYALAGNRLWAMDDRTSPWRPVDAGLPHGSIDAVSVDPRETRRVWATAGGQVFRSDDGATTWRPWGRPLDDARVSVRGIAASARGRDAVLTTDRGLYRSADGGSWQMPGDSLPAHLEAWPLVRDPRDPDTLYAGFALVPYSELWRLAAERRAARAREDASGVTSTVTFVALVALAAATAGGWLWRFDRQRRARATAAPDGPQ
jgi:photosystem II stability/assembly factor-like uncharacterized protein